MALKQSHVNQLRKIIAAAETLIVAIERDMQSPNNTKASKGKAAAPGRGRPAGKKTGKKTTSPASTNGKGKGKGKGKGNGKGKATKTTKTAQASASGTRRNRAQTAEFRQSILQQLQSGTSVADLAAKHGITPAYIYQIKNRAEA